MNARALIALFALIPLQIARAQTEPHTKPHPPTTSPAKGAPMTDQAATLHATGPFDIKMTPQPLADPSADSTLSRMSLDKHFHGDLEAASKGEMLTAGAPAQGSAGYVAIEHVTGTLHGRAGAFSLQHSGSLTHGVPQLTVTVVPGSGTGQLAGLTGSMTITNTAGKHTYDFEYALPAQQ